MLNIDYTTQFKKDYKAVLKRNLDIELLKYVVEELAQGKTLAVKYKDHILTGIYVGYHECHIKPDWLLIYYLEPDTLILTRTGSHSDLF